MSDPREVLERLDRNTACGYYEGKLSDDDVAALKSLLKAEDRVKTLEKYLPQILDECESTRVRLARSLEGEHIDSVTAERAYDDMDSAVFSLRALLNSDVTRPSLFETAAKMPSSVLVTADAQGPASGECQHAKRVHFHEDGHMECLDCGVHAPHEVQPAAEVKPVPYSHEKRCKALGYEDPYGPIAMEHCGCADTLPRYSVRQGDCDTCGHWRTKHYGKAFQCSEPDCTCAAYVEQDGPTWRQVEEAIDAVFWAEDADLKPPEELADDLRSALGLPSEGREDGT